MKRTLLNTALLWLICVVFISLLFLYFYLFPRGLNFHKNLGENESIYKGELVFAGKGPEITFEPTVDEGTVVMKGYFEYHSDHIFLDYNILFEKYPMKMSELFYTPGNVVKFNGVVKALDSAAGNHYYEVKSIDKLELVRYPNIDEIKEIFDSYNYCESDSDCGYIVGKCPFGCYIPVNKSFINVSNLIINNYYMNNQEEKCVYGCVAMDKVVCENYKCVMKSSEESGENKELITCTSEQKSAENCNMIYDPVCGSDSRTYGNNCVACQSETVESYTQGECESSAFTVEGDSDYLQQVMNILENDGAVSCDYSYDDNGTTVYGRFMADGNRFYSSAENQDYVLATGDKTYFWSSSSESEKTIIDSPTDIESEIASLLMDKGKNPDFNINCSGGIEDESLFTASEN